MDKQKVDDSIKVYKKTKKDLRKLAGLWEITMAECAEKLVSGALKETIGLLGIIGVKVEPVTEDSVNSYLTELDKGLK